MVDIFYLFNRDKLESIPNKENVSGCREGQMFSEYTGSTRGSKLRQPLPRLQAGSRVGRARLGHQPRGRGKGGLREASEQFCCSITGTGAGGPRV